MNYLPAPVEGWIIQNHKWVLKRRRNSFAVLPDSGEVLDGYAWVRYGKVKLYLVLKCGACNQWHKGPWNSRCKQSFEQGRAYA